jgi:CheY-like chemotaxis protein
VLIVDDDPGIRETIANILRDERYVVATAGNGTRALEMMSHGFRPSLILLDLWMPETDGFMVLDTMRADGALASIPVVVMTAGADADHDATVKRCADLVLHKPLHFGDLLAAVERYAPFPRPA